MSQQNGVDDILTMISGKALRFNIGDVSADNRRIAAAVTG